MTFVSGEPQDVRRRRASLLRRIGLIAAFCLVGASGVHAETPPSGSATYSLSGNSRAQIGSGLPLPIGFTPVPDGKIQVVPGATVLQTGVDPKTMRVNGAVLSFDGAPLVLAQFLANPNVFQVKTDLSFGAGVTSVLPTATFKPGGRTGSPTVTFCAGRTAELTCTSPNQTGNLINGLMRYTKTRNQFGGVGPGRVSPYLFFYL